MTSLLELPDVRERVHRMSVEEYHRAGEAGVLGKDVELLRGIVVTKMPKSPLHELIALKLSKRLMAQVPAGFEVRKESPLTLQGSEPEPDISVVQGAPDNWAAAHPSTAHLVVEVAVSRADFGKAELYAEAGIPEYWLVRAADRTVSIYRDPTPAGYGSETTVKDQETLRCGSIPRVEVRVADILPVEQ